jgi:hypothetical protein
MIAGSRCVESVLCWFVAIPIGAAGSLPTFVMCDGLRCQDLILPTLLLLQGTVVARLFLQFCFKVSYNLLGILLL